MNAPAANLDRSRFGVYGIDPAGNTTITYTRVLNHPIEKVWRAISEQEHRAAWFPELSLETSVGGRAVVNFGNEPSPSSDEDANNVFVCEVTRCDPPNVLEYAGPREHHRFELTTLDSGCRLTFLATLPDSAAYDDEGKTIQSRYSVACGWHYKLDQMEWDLDGIPFEDEGYAGPIKTEYYFVYRKLDRK